MKWSGMLRPTCTLLSHDTERCLKTKTTNLHRTPPLIMHSVGGSLKISPHFPPWFFGSRFVVGRFLRSLFFSCRLFELS